MTTHGGRMARTLRAVSGAALAALLTVLMLSVHATPAAASTDHTVTLGLSNVRVDIDAGDSVTYDVIGGAYQVLGGVAGSTVRYTNAGTYTVSWSVQKVVSVLGPLGKAVSKITQIATCTATIVVAPVVSTVTSAASKVVSKATRAVNKVVPTVHVRVSVPRVAPSPSRSSGHPAAPSPTTSAVAPAPAAGGSSSGSGQTGGLTATAGDTSPVSAGSVPGVPAAGAAAAPPAGAGAGAGGARVAAMPGGSVLQPVSMNRPAAGSGERASAAERRNAQQASAVGSARLPVLLAIFAIVALAGVTIGYVRFSVFGRML